MAELVSRENKIILQNKKALSITGVVKVNSVNETFASVDTSCGTLYISGKNLKIQKLLVEEGIVEIEGEIEGMKYGAKKQTGGFFKRIFK